jgi:hypothetical protein
MRNAPMRSPAASALRICCDLDSICAGDHFAHERSNENLSSAREAVQDDGEAGRQRSGGGTTKDEMPISGLSWPTTRFWRPGGRQVAAVG